MSANLKTTLTWLLLGLLFAAAPANALVCVNNTGQQNYGRHSLSWILSQLPCGITDDDDYHCFRYWTNFGPNPGCVFSLGGPSWNNPNYIQIWWYGDENGNLPSEQACKQLEQAIPLCQSPPEEPDPGCPNPTVSDPCIAFCEGQELTAAPPVGWNEECGAYALMGRDWRSKPWESAVAFLPRGRAFPPEAFAWRVGDRPYTAVDAFYEGWLGDETMLGAAGSSKIWGDRDGIIPGGYREVLAQADVCVNEPGALLGSYDWEGPTMSKRFPALVTCEGPNAEARDYSMWMDASRWSSETWAASGARAEDILPRLERLPGLELVCVTAEIARERALQRLSTGK